MGCDVFFDLIVIAVVSILSVSGANVIARGATVSKVERAIERRMERRSNDTFVVPMNNKVVAYKFE